MPYFAHLYYDSNGTVHSQTVAQHCHETAEYAAENLRKIGIPSAGYLAGLLHDAGKYQDAFQKYLKDAASGKDVKRGSVIHTFQGCRHLIETFHHEKVESFDDLTSEVLGFAIGAHHGLFDCIDQDKHSGFQHRLTEDKANYEESIDRFLQDCTGSEELTDIFAAACKEITPIYNKIMELSVGDSYDKDLYFYIGLLTRLLLSSVIDGDRRSTADFMNSQGSLKSHATQQLWHSCLAHLEKELEKLPTDSAIQKARHTISEKCKASSVQAPGIFRLNVPTGAGKTISSLRFALSQSAFWDKEHIIFVSPLLSILEQNAAVIRQFVGNDRIILEHHSNVINTVKNADELDSSELLTDTWDSPIIITTLVQLLNTMFDGRTTCIRRFHALADSVIVIDEVQTVPNKMLSLFNLTVTFLSQICGTTIVLCSATQPCLEKTEHPIRAEIRNIVPYEASIWGAFKRTKIVDSGSLSIEEIPAFVNNELRSKKSILIVCNKKSESEQLFRALLGPDRSCFHLSSSMCMQHRRDVLADLEIRLADSRKNGTKVICISTQVIEAGVDISFECVVRLRAGIDNIIQAAGRCNRNGESDSVSDVFVIGCKNENLGFLREIQYAKDAATDLFYAFKTDPVQFQNELTSDVAVAHYYSSLYHQMPEQYQDYTVGKTSVFSLLSQNELYADEEAEGIDKFFLRQAFLTGGQLFSVFDNNTYDVVVPYKNGADLIKELCSHRREDPVFLKSWLSRAKQYTISLYDYQIKKLANGGLYQVDNILILQSDYYDLETGFTQNGNKFDLWEV